MSSKVVFLPLRIGLTVTRTTLALSARLAARVAGEVVRVAESRFSTPTPAQSASAPAEQATASPDAPAAPGAAAVVPLGDDVVSPLEEYPDTPLTREEADAKTIDDTDEVVAEFAEAGAEDGAGAQIVFDEPWEGYDAANAEAITNEIAGADAAEIAVIELYEQTHEGRKTVLDAAARRLQELSPPN